MMRGGGRHKQAAWSRRIDHRTGLPEDVRARVPLSRAVLIIVFRLNVRFPLARVTYPAH